MSGVLKRSSNWGVFMCGSLMPSAAQSMQLGSLGRAESRSVCKERAVTCFGLFLWYFWRGWRKQRKTSVIILCFEATFGPRRQQIWSISAALWIVSFYVTFSNTNILMAGDYGAGTLWPWKRLFFLFHCLFSSLVLLYFRYIIKCELRKIYFNKLYKCNWFSVTMN
jgi:hypothetical protein